MSHFCVYGSTSHESVHEPHWKASLKFFIQVDSQINNFIGFCNYVKKSKTSCTKNASLNKWGNYQNWCVNWKYRPRILFFAYRCWQYANQTHEVSNEKSTGQARRVERNQEKCRTTGGDDKKENGQDVGRRGTTKGRGRWILNAVISE